MVPLMFHCFPPHRYIILASVLHHDGEQRGEPVRAAGDSSRSRVLPVEEQPGSDRPTSQVSHPHTTRSEMSTDVSSHENFSNIYS